MKPLYHRGQSQVERDSTLLDALGAEGARWYVELIKLLPQCLSAREQLLFEAAPLERKVQQLNYWLLTGRLPPQSPWGRS